MENSFEVKNAKCGEIQIISPCGYLDAHTAPELENAIRTAIDAGEKFLLVDFESLDYISSAGLGVFMAFIEDIREIGGDIKMSSLKQKVYAVFDLLGFPILFDILPTKQEGIAKFDELIAKP
ncbi:MAG: STAS domain-containing protein [Candidatus Kapabacteria bacterium]|nr:STAS domain-containing protein [Candidatus Kapabacteria bacterium]